jgi:hypothetical protein
LATVAFSAPAFDMLYIVRSGGEHHGKK